MMIYKNSILVLLFVTFCSCQNRNNSDSTFLKGKWLLPETEHYVTIKSKTIEINREEETLYVYSFVPDSLIKIAIPESEQAYSHTLHLKIKYISSNGDTVIFTDDYIGAEHLAYRIAD